jgi:hypothetical protein
MPRRGADQVLADAILQRARVDLQRAVDGGDGLIAVYRCWE